MSPAKVPCPNCQTTLEIQVAPSTIINREYYTVVLVDHSGINTCPVCNVAVVPVIAAVASMAVQLVPYKPPQEKLIVPARNTGL